jgi:hypothetical protein
VTSLAEKLKSMGVTLGAGNLPPPKPHNPHDIEHVVQGRFEATPFGESFVTETVYPAGHHHGHAELRLAGSLHTVAEWARDHRVADMAPDSFVFLDTETSGLAGGTGTYAFLVGIGRHSPQGFRLTQVFMRDPIQEPALLHLVDRLLRPCDALVTFNGKSFDVPLLATRFALQGAALPLAGAAHLDLLPLARRLWRDRLESRALSFLETHILGAQRAEEEVPGWLVPQIYFDYLRNGDARPLKGVFYHNAMDVVALAALFSHVTGLLDDPLANGREHGSDLVALARLFEELGQADRALALYQKGLEGDLAEEVFVDAVRRLSFLQRRRGQTLAALELWRRAAHGHQVYAHEALAKFYEHELRDYEQALAWTEAALRLVDQTLAPERGRDRWLTELQHRRQRLERKLRGHESRTGTGKR